MARIDVLLHPMQEYGAADPHSRAGAEPPVRFPFVFGRTPESRCGSILVTRAANSGISTAPPAMVDRWNGHENGPKDDHILTLADRSEFIHSNRSRLVNRRQAPAGARPARAKQGA